MPSRLAKNTTNPKHANRKNTQPRKVSENKKSKQLNACHASGFSVKVSFLDSLAGDRRVKSRIFAIHLCLQVLSSVVRYELKGGGELIGLDG